MRQQVLSLILANFSLKALSNGEKIIFCLEETACDLSSPIPVCWLQLPGKSICVQYKIV